ncbi:MAG: hypothetical protein Q9222_002518 [Ikaeria aurantiellina]
MEKGVTSQMKWKPSCKAGTAKFSYSAVVPSTATFLTLFKLDAGWKKKMLHFAPSSFQQTTYTDISAGIRNHR